MNLRPHHLLCIQKFTGHGYNEEFTEHMKKVVAKLTDEPATQITVARGCDDLCQRCPNQVNQACTSLDKVALMDQAVLSICHLAYGESAAWADLAGRARKRIFETDEFRHICADCQWIALCRNTEISGKNQLE